MNTTIFRLCAFAPIAAALSFISLHLSTAQADTPVQTQKAIQAVCSRAAVSYQRRDLSGLIAMYSPAFLVRNVSGRKVNSRQNMAGFANIFAKDDFHASAVCTASQVILQGTQARAILHWHFVSRTVHAKLPYTVTRLTR